MQIPEYFLHKAARQFGDAGPGWVRDLPAILAHCQDVWGLTQCTPAADLSINLVCYAQSATHGPVVLKISGPHTERYTEMRALRIYAGRHACRCLECDENVAAVLLERIIPGDVLRALPDKRKQLEIGADMAARLPVPASTSDGFPRYADWVSRAIEVTRIQYDPGAQMLSLMARARDLYHELCPEGGAQYLLHGDLHHDNILRHHDGSWRVIDPQGVIGAPFMEAGRFIENHADCPAGFDRATLDEAVTHFAERMGVSQYTIAGATFVLHVLSTCWGYEMNYTPGQIEQQIAGCEDLSDYLRGLQ